MTQHTYQAVVKSVSEAVSQDNKSKDKWVTAGVSVNLFYPSCEALEAVKAQFIADAILPSVDKKHAQALAVDLPRKGSKEFKELSEANQAKWEDANQAKKDARATCDTYFSRVLNYAFPKPKAESKPVNLKDRIQKTVADLVDKCGKAESPDFDVVAVKAALENVLTLVNK
jgi:hypothetical protein